jgi:hypothetical protein
LVRALVRVHLKARQADIRRKRLNVAALNSETTSSALKNSIQNCFTHIANPENFAEDQSVDEQRQDLKTKVYPAALNSLGTSTRLHKDWISSRTIDLAKQTASARTNDPTLYRILRRQTSMSARSDRNAYWSEMARQMEQATHVGDTRRLCHLIRSQRKSQAAAEKFRDLSGAVITDFEARSQRWVEHFDLLLNHDDPPLPNELLEPPATITDSVYASNCDPPTVEEIMSVIVRLKTARLLAKTVSVLNSSRYVQRRSRSGYIKYSAQLGLKNNFPRTGEKPSYSPSSRRAISHYAKIIVELA